MKLTIREITPSTPEQLNDLARVIAETIVERGRQLERLERLLEDLELEEDAND